MGIRLDKMSVRTFIFCDGCNPQGIRNIYNGVQRARRNSDGRAWYEGPLDEAVQLGWVVSKQGYTLCPTCIDKGLIEMFKDSDIDANDLMLNMNTSFATNFGN